MMAIMGRLITRITYYNNSILDADLQRTEGIQFYSAGHEDDRVNAPVHLRVFTPCIASPLTNISIAKSI